MSTPYQRDVAVRSINEDARDQGVTINQLRTPVIFAADAARTFTPQEAGLIVLPVASVARALLIPEPATVPGRSYKFVLNADPLTADWTIATIAGATVFVGGVSDWTGGVGTKTNGTSVAIVRFDNGVALEGDYVNLTSDGVKYWIDGGMANTVAILFA